MADSRVRHLAKTMTWRIIGTLDTMILAWLISGSLLTGLKIGAAEIVTKMILYYLHERAWYKINFGLDRRSERKNRQERAKKVSENIVYQDFKIDHERRRLLLDQGPFARMWIARKL